MIMVSTNNSEIRTGKNCQHFICIALPTYYNAATLRYISLRPHNFLKHFHSSVTGVTANETSAIHIALASAVNSRANEVHRDYQLVIRLGE